MSEFTIEDIPKLAPESPDTLATPVTGIPQSNANPLLDVFGQPDYRDDHEKAMDAWRQESFTALDAAVIDPKSYGDERVPSGYTPDEWRKTRVVDDWMRLHSDGEAPPIGLSREFTRARLAERVFGGAGAENDDALYGEITKAATGRKDEKDFQRKLMAAVADDVAMPTGTGKGMAGFLKSAKGHAGYDPGKAADYSEAWAETRAQVAEKMAPYREQLDQVWKARRNGGEVTPETLASIPDEDLPGFLQALRLRAETLGDEEKETFLAGMRKDFARTVEGFGENAMNSAIDAGFGMSATGRPLDDKINRDFAPGEWQAAKEGSAKARNRAHEVNRIMSGSFDPIDYVEGWGWAQKIPGVTATSLSMAVPVAGPVTMAASMSGAVQESAYLRMRDSGMSEQDASEVSSALGPVVMVPQMALELIGYGAWGRNLPWLNKIVDGMGDMVANRAARFAIKTGVITGIEGTTEVMQDFTEYLVQDMAAAIAPHVPDVDLGKEFAGAWRKFPETAGSMLLLSLFGAAGGMNAEARAQAWAKATPRQMTALGITPEGIQRIEEAQARGPASLLATVTDEFSTRDPNTPAAAAAAEAEAAELKQKAASQRQAVADLERLGYAAPTFTTTPEGVFVFDSDGNELGMESDYAGASRIAAAHTTALVNMEKDRVDALTTLMEGVKAAVALDPTSETEVNLGEFDPAQATPGMAARFAAQVALKEVAEGGTGKIARSVLGYSVTEMAQGVRHTVNRLFKGASITDAFHETGHGLRRKAHAAGTITRAMEASLLINQDTVYAGRRVRDAQGKPKGTDLRLVPDGITAAMLETGEIPAAMIPAEFDGDGRRYADQILDEGVSEIIEAEVLKLRKGQARGKLGITRELVQKNLQAMARLNATDAKSWKSFFAAVRGHWGLAMSRAVAMAGAERRGEFDPAERDAYLDKLLGLDQQTEHDAGVQDEFSRMLAGFDDVDMEEDDIPFSIGVTVAPVRKDALSELTKGEVQKRSGSAKFIHLQQVASDVAAAYGVTIEGRQPTVGGWTENGEVSLEVPEVITFATDDMDIAEEMAALIAASAPELQNAAMIWRDDDAGEDHMVHFTAKSAAAALDVAKALEMAGVQGFSYDTQTREFSLVLAGWKDEDVSRVHEFLQYQTKQGSVSAGKGHSKGTKVGKGSARFPSEGDYRKHIENARSRADNLGGAQGEAIREVASRAERRVDRYEAALKISKKAKRIIKKLPLPMTSAKAIIHELKGRTFDSIRALGLYLDDRFQKIHGFAAFPVGSAEGITAAAEAFTYDILDGLSRDGSGMGWYDERVTETIRELVKLHPEFAQDPLSLAVYIGILSTTSQGYTVVTNFAQTERVWEIYKKTGRIPTDLDFAKSTEPINQNLAEIQALIDEHGLQGYADFMDEIVTGKTLRDQYGMQPTGVTLTDEVRGNRFLGPKIGSFFNNLRGRFDTITMDLWYTRTMHRYIGETVVPLDNPKVQKALKSFRDEIQKDGARTYNIDIATALESDEATVRAALTVFGRWGAGKNDYTEKGYTKFKDGYKIEKAARTIHSEGTMKGAPQNKSYRTYFAAVVKQTKQNLAELGIKLTEADIQAIIWYREKNLFAETGVANNAAKPADYLDAVMVARQKAVNSDPAFSIGRAMPDIENLSPVANRVEAHRLYAEGKLLYGIDEQSEELSLVTSMEMLNAYPPDALGYEDPDDQGFSLGPAQVAGILSDNALSRITDPRRRTYVMSRIARDFNAMRLQIERITSLSGIRRSKGDLRREAMAREDLAAEEKIAAIHQRFGSLLADEDLVKIKSQPVHSFLSDPTTPLRGRVMSKRQAIKNHPDVFQLHRAGDYDGSDGVSRSVFGGQRMPDQAAQELFDEGLISEPTADAMWEALLTEQKTVAGMKEMLAKATEQIREAKAQAKQEANEWLATQGKDQEVNFSDKEEIRRSLRMLDAILLALPAEIRGKIGGYTQISMIASDDARLAYLKDKLAKADKELEDFLRVEYAKEWEELLVKAAPKTNEAGQRPTGSIAADAYDVFRVAEHAMGMGFAEGEAEADKWDAIADHPDTDPKDVDLARVKAQMIRLTMNWPAADAARREQAVLEGDKIYFGGLRALAIENSRRRERLGEKRDSLVVGTGKTGIWPEIDDANIRDATQGGKVKKLAWSFLSFGQLVNVIAGEDSAFAKWANAKELSCSNAAHDGFQSKANALESLFDTLSGNRFDGEKLRHRMVNDKTVTVKDTLGIAYNFSESQAITFLLMYRQEDGRRHMQGIIDDSGRVVSSWGWDDTQAAKVESQLSKEGRAVMAFLGSSYGEEYDRINAVFRRIWNVSMPRHKMYSPLSVAPANASTSNVVDPSSGDVMSGTMTPGSLKNRSFSAIARPDFKDAFQVYTSHARAMEHFIAYGEFTRDILAVINRREARDAIHASAGAVGANVLSKWVDYFALGGIHQATAGDGWVEFMGGIAGRIMPAALIGRVSVLCMQSLQLAAASFKMPTGAFLTRFAKLSAGRLQWGDTIQSEYIQRRVQQLPPVVRDMMQGLANGTPNRAKYLAGMAGRTISGADALFTAGTYAIFYDYHLGLARKSGATNPEAQAHAEAERLTDQVAQPVRTGARSWLEVANAGNPAFRAAWNFASDPRQKMSLLVYAAMRRDTSGAEKAGDVAFTAAKLWIIGGVMQTLLRTVLRDLRNDDDDEIFDERYWSPARLALQVGTGPLGAVPFFGDMVEGFTYKLTGQFMPQGGLLNFLDGAGAMFNRWGDGKVAPIKDAETLTTAGAGFSGTSAAAASAMHIIRDVVGFIENLEGPD